MKSKSCLLLIWSVLIGFVSPAQTEKELLGSWKFESVYGRNDLDETSLAMAEKFFGDLSITLLTDHKFHFIAMESEDQGSWQLKDKIIQLTSDKGDIQQVQILEFNKESMGVKLSSGSFMLAKEDADTKVVAANLNVVTAKEELLYQKWYLKKREIPGKPLEIINAMMQNGSPFLELKQNGSFNANLFEWKEKGDWTIENNNTKLALTGKEESKYFQFRKISEQEMELYNDHTAEIWYFSTHE